MSKKEADLVNPIGYKSGEQHVGSSSSDVQSPQAGCHGQPDSHIAGQRGPEILGGSASTRILSQSTDEQLHTNLPAKSGDA